MISQAFRHVIDLDGTAAEKANLFERLVAQISELDPGSWSASRGLTADGGHIFLGEVGEAVVISPGGQLYRGSIRRAGIDMGVHPPVVDYGLLRLLE